MKKGTNQFKGKLLNLYISTHTYPNGYRGRIEYLQHPGAVLVIPVLERGAMVMIRQYRPVPDTYLWEFPAGTLEKGEKPLACAKRELIEEAGYAARTVTKLGTILPCPGYSTEQIHIYKATGLTKVKRNVMPDEVISSRIFSHREVRRLFYAGKIIDAKTICALTWLDHSQSSRKVSKR